MNRLEKIEGVTLSKTKSGLNKFKYDKKQKLNPVEDAEQIILNNFCRIQWPRQYGLMFHAVNESGGKGSAQYGRKLKAKGRKSGVSDWIVLVPNDKHHGLIIELKRTNGVDSDLDSNQTLFLKNASDNNYYACVCFGADAAIYAIDKYLRDEL